jgi:hypothetical protein
MSMYFNFKNQSIKFILLCAILSGLVACGRVTHEPKAGEYGVNLVNSAELTESQISAFNTAAVTKPKDTFKRPNGDIGFQADPSKNPYRFVLVARGTAIHDGEVDLKMIGGVESEAANGYHPEVYRADDQHHYKANEPVLLVVSSDPFSVSSENNKYYDVHAELMETSNFRFQSVQSQIWQGKGSQYNLTSYLKFLVVLMVFLFAIYRVISR